MEKLFSSFRIGAMELKNRFVFPPIKTALGTPSGEVTDRHRNFYNSISRNGPALIILEPVSVTPEGREHPKQLQITNDTSADELKKLVELIHENHRKACLHLNHAGGAANPKVISASPRSASAFTCPSTGAEVHPLSKEEIQEIIDGFGDAARKAKSAGFDALELQAGHGYLLSQFINPEINKRDDEYGNDRTLLLREVLDRIIESASGLAIILRVSGDEMAPAKSTPAKDIDAAVKTAEQAGINALHVGMGSSCFSPPWYFHHMSLPFEPQEKALERLKQSVQVPCVVAGRMGSQERCTRMMSRGLADLIALGRPLIADPDLISKWEGADKKAVQRCGYCLQGCLVHVKDGSGIGCNFNPRVAEPDLQDSDETLTVLVAGGGPAGVSAGRYLASRGHRATLAEESEDLGGMAPLAPLSPGKENMEKPIHDFFCQDAPEGMEVLLSHKVDLELVRKIKPDLLVWATGAKPKMPFYPGMDKVHLITCPEAFENQEKVKGKRVLVIGAGRNGLELAERLGKQGYQVAATKRTDALGSYMEPISKNLCLARISKMPNVSLLPLTTVLEFFPEGVKIKNGDSEQMLPPFDTVILCAGMLPGEGPPEEIAAKVSKTEVIGDERDPRDIYSAVKEGYELSLKY
ncbi:MAG: FAD-dependent oxidoreductase [bacterium]